MRKKGFTLIELLVVISIIALLLSILMPALGRVRESARQVVCLSNIRQMTLGLNMYDSEKGTYPHKSSNRESGDSPTGVSSTDWYWFDYAIAALGGDVGVSKKSIIHCPGNKVKINREGEGLELVGNYGVNQLVCRAETWFGGYKDTQWQGKPYSAQQIKNPSATCLILDFGGVAARYTMTNPAGMGHIYAEHYLPGFSELYGDPEVKPRLYPECWSDAIDGRHPGKKVNIGFVDGHAGTREAADAAVHPDPTEYAQSRWANFYPFWSPKER